MKGHLRGAFRALTFVLLAVSAWTAYANVLADDSDVRATANELAREKAGCVDHVDRQADRARARAPGCKMTGIVGDRGMLETRIVYDVDGRERVTVTCKRPFVAFGAFACVAEGPR